MSQKLVVETWGELGSISGIKEIMPLETEVANAMKAEGVSRACSSRTVRARKRTRTISPRRISRCTRKGRPT